ncbi:unnamed protein product [Eretmochelys imbricata]
MVPLELVSLLMVTLAARCESQQMREPPARWVYDGTPPPVISFLKQLWGAQRGPPLAAPAPQEPRPAAGARPPWYVQPEGAGEALGLPRSPQRRIPRQLSPQTTGRGCQLGTCQTHHLFNWLYHIGASDHKDDSRKDMADPMGLRSPTALGGEPWPAPGACPPPPQHPLRAGLGTAGVHGAPPRRDTAGAGAAQHLCPERPGTGREWGTA